MKQYAGIDVSLERSSVCVVEGKRRYFARGQSGQRTGGTDRLVRVRPVSTLRRIGLEAGPLSQWLFAAMRQAGLAVELLETRQGRKAFEAMPVKSDRNDARGIAQLMRLGWFRPVHCKSMSAQETRALLTARKLVQIEASRRGEQPARDPARLWSQGGQDDFDGKICGTDRGARGGPFAPPR